MPKPDDIQGTPGAAAPTEVQVENDAFNAGFDSLPDTPPEDTPPPAKPDDKGDDAGKVRDDKGKFVATPPKPEDGKPADDSKKKDDAAGKPDAATPAAPGTAAERLEKRIAQREKEYQDYMASQKKGGDAGAPAGDQPPPAKPEPTPEQKKIEADLAATRKELADLKAAGGSKTATNDALGFDLDAAVAAEPDGPGKQAALKVQSELPEVDAALNFKVQVALKKILGAIPKPDENAPKTAEETIKQLNEMRELLHIEQAQRRYDIQVENGFTDAEGNQFKGHPDRWAVINDPKFNEWVKKQSPGVRKMYFSLDPRDGCAILDAYKETLVGAAKSKVETDAKNRKKTWDAAHSDSLKPTNPSGRQADKPSGDDAEDFKAGFDSV